MPFPIFGGLPDGVNPVFDEDRLLRTINAVLRGVTLPQLDSVAQLFARLNMRWLTTIPEFDHYGPRSHETYLGVCLNTATR